MAVQQYIDLAGLEKYNILIKDYINKRKVELTLAEYNALTEEQKNDDIIYFITDGEIESEIGGGGGVIRPATESYAKLSGTTDEQGKITFEDKAINDDAIFNFYTEVWEVSPVAEPIVEEGKLTLDFGVDNANMQIKVLIF